MRSLYSRIFVTCLGTLVPAFLAFLVISLNVGLEKRSHNFGLFYDLELKHAEHVYQERGADSLAEFLKSLDDSFGSRHFFVDAEGRDVLTGNDMNWLVAQATPPGWLGTFVRSFTNGEATVVIPSRQSSYRTITISRPWSTSRDALPYYFAVVVLVAAVNAFMGARIVAALNGIARAAQAFGAGDLSARVSDVARDDEVGQVGAEFNRMADRIHGLVESERRLLQDVSHELRSPLARLAFAVEAAESRDAGPGGFEPIRRQIQTLKTLAGSLLQVTQPADVAPFPTRTNVPVANLIAEAVDCNQLNAQERRCLVQIEAVPREALVNGDSHALVRMLDNVLRNAIAHSPVGGPIKVTAAVDDDTVMLAVRDHGDGVPESMAERIFDPFFRVDESRQPSTGGTGLGLAIVRRIVLSHGGHVEARNASPGTGLLVTIALPRVLARSTVA